MQAPHRAISPRDARERLLLNLLDVLWERYRRRVEHVRRYEALVERHGATFLNDHVAFRTIAWQDPAAGIFQIARLFEALGYAAAACYDFPDKRLSAIHFRHPNPAFPKLFISELRAWELPNAARRIIARSLNEHRPPFPEARLARLTGPHPPSVAKTLVKEADDHFRERPWPAPERGDVEALDRVSQYGAWVLLHGYEVNHFTASVDAHGPGPLADIELTVAALRQAGVPMKPEIEGERGSRLRQSSTDAAVIEVEARVRGRVSRIPWTYAYFELAERPALKDAATGRVERFQGFLGGQATHLFEMTRYQAGGRAS